MNIPAPFNLSLNDGRSRGTWLFQLTGVPEVKWMTQDQFSVVLNSEGRRIGDFDEQRDWKGGRGGERFSDDPSKYKDGKNVFSAIENHIFSGLQWKISEGYRVAEQALPGSLTWRGLYGGMRYISRSFTCSPAMTSDKAYLWARRVGTPGTLTFELRSDSTGSPGTVLKTVTKTAADFTDVVSEFMTFDWTGTQALSDATVYHIVIYGASTDDVHNHYEVGVDMSGTSSKFGTGSSWTTADFSMFFRVTDADIDRRWWYFYQGSNFCKVSNQSTAALYKWNETSDLWEEVAAATHGLGQVTGRPIEVNGFVYFPQGDTVAIRVWDGTNWDAQTIATGQGCATGLAVGYSASDNTSQIWRYNNALVSGGTATGLAKSVSRADAVGAYTTDLTFRNSIRTGDTTSNILNIHSVNNTLYVFKSNQTGVVDNDRFTELNYGVRNTPSSDNGIAAINWNGMLYFNWLFTTMRLYSGTVDDVGQGFRSNSFPYGRDGIDSAYAAYVSWLFTANDAGSGTSSVLLYDGLNWHEMMRSFTTGKRIREVFIQTVSDARNRLWIDHGGDSVYIELPLKKGNPLDDSGMSYMHESVVESSIIDMGTASKLPKYIKELTATVKNLDGSGKRVEVDYRVDDDTEWTHAGTLLLSPEDTVKINETNIRKFQYRLRMLTDNYQTPIDVSGVVPNGFARSPMRKIFSFEADVRNITVNGKKQAAKDVIRWLEEVSESAFTISMDSKFEQLDDHYDLIIAPPSIYPIRAVPEADKITFSGMVL